MESSAIRLLKRLVDEVVAIKKVQKILVELALSDSQSKTKNTGDLKDE